MKILVLHGPNLNLLGEREPHIYGEMTLEEINQKIHKHAQKRGFDCKIFQSNSEGRLIDLIHEFRKWATGIIFNPAAFTHYSYALRDAIQAVNIPTIEVHLSDLSEREDFRKNSVIADVCVEQVMGLGWGSYIEALNRIYEKIPV